MACTHLDTPDILTQAQSLGTATQRYTHTEVQPHRGAATQKYSHTEVYVTSKLCLNSQWPVSLVPPDGLGGGKCFQTSSEHGGTD